VQSAESSDLAIPTLGLGTFGSDKYGPDVIARAVIDAAEIGYRHFDCAAVYGNERAIGEALRNVQNSGIPREQIWVTSKLWNDRHGDAIAACEQSLRDLKLAYLDLYLIHWPFPNHHGAGVDVSSRDPHAKPYRHEEYMVTWRQLECLVERGLVRKIGTSNMSVSKLQGLLKDAAIRPFATQMELHPHFQQIDLFEYVRSQGIVPIAYSPLGSPSRPARDRTPEDTCDLEDSTILEIAEAHGITPGAVCIRWAVQRGSIPIPFSVKREQIEANLAATQAPPLSGPEMEKMGLIDRNSRLIKGQVFLWEGAKSWEELWT